MVFNNEALKKRIQHIIDILPPSAKSHKKIKLPPLKLYQTQLANMIKSHHTFNEDLLQQYAVDYYKAGHFDKLILATVNTYTSQKCKVSDYDLYYIMNFMYYPIQWMDLENRGFGCRFKRLLVLALWDYIFDECPRKPSYEKSYDMFKNIKCDFAITNNDTHII